MTALYAQSIAQRTFLTIPLFLVVASAIFYPLASEYWEGARNISLAFYVGAFFFLRNASFEQASAQVSISLPLRSWVIGIGLTLTSFFLATGLQLLFDFSALLQIVI